MKNDSLEHRLNKLKRSYEQLPIENKADDVMDKLEKEIMKANRKKWFKLSATLVAAAVIFIAGGITWQEIRSNDNQISQEANLSESKSDEKHEEWYTSLNEKYDQWILESKEDLKLSEETFNQYINIKGVESYLLSAKRWFNNEMGINENLKQRTESDIQYMILSPNQVITHLDDFENPVAFLNTYTSKIKHLKEIAKQLHEVNPNDPQLANLKKQNIVKVESNYGPQYVLNYEPLLPLLGTVLPESYIGYFEVLSKNSYTYGGSLLFTPEETVNSLLKLEQTLLDVSLEDLDETKLVKIYYTSVMLQLLQGGEHYSLIEEDILNPRYVNIIQKLSKESVIIKELAEQLLLNDVNTIRQEANRITISDLEVLIYKAQKSL